LEGLALEYVGIIFGRLVYFIAIWSISWLFGIFYGHLVYFMVNWYIFQRLVCCIKINLATLGCERRLEVKILLRQLKFKATKSLFPPSHLKAGNWKVLHAFPSFR
jgi:hypothetical protein